MRSLAHYYAQYYDTPERHLAQQHISLRQRLEDTHWIQTLKASSEHHLERFELEIDLGATRASRFKSRNLSITSTGKKSARTCFRQTG